MTIIFLSCFFKLENGEGNGTPLQYSCLENPMDGGAWWAAVRGAARSRTRLSNFTFTFHFHALEKEMAIHSSVLAWRIPGTGELGGLPSMGLHRVGHDWSDLAAAAAAAGGRMNPMLIHYSWKWKNNFSLNFYFILAYSWFIMLCLRYTTKWISYTYFHSFSDSYPIKVVREYWVEFLVL